MSVIYANYVFLLDRTASWLFTCSSGTSNNRSILWEWQSFSCHLPGWKWQRIVSLY